MILARQLGRRPPSLGHVMCSPHVDPRPPQEHCDSLFVTEATHEQTLYPRSLIHPRRHAYDVDTPQCGNIEPCTHHLGHLYFETENTWTWKHRIGAEEHFVG